MTASCAPSTTGCQSPKSPRHPIEPDGWVGSDDRSWCSNDAIVHIVWLQTFLLICLLALVNRRHKCEHEFVELDRNGLRILNPRECVALLATARVGRVALSDRALPTVRPVIYELDESTITFHASGGLLLEAAARGDVVCFEVDFADAGENRVWSVVVVGKLRLATLEASRSATTGKRFGTHKISLPMTIVSGRATRSALQIV